MFVLPVASYRHSLDSALITPVLYLNHRSKSRMMGEVHRRPSAYLALALRRRRRCFSTPPNGLNVQNGLCFGPSRPTTAILPTLRDPKQNVTRVGQRVTEAKCRGRAVPSSNTGIQLELQAAPCHAPNLALEKQISLLEPRRWSPRISLKGQV